MQPSTSAGEDPKPKHKSSKSMKKKYVRVILPSSSSEDNSDDIGSNIMSHDHTATGEVEEPQRMRNESRWEPNLCKKARAEGTELVTRKGKTIQTTQMGPGCGKKCRNLCKN